MSLPVRVVKIGGSLFERADLAQQLRSWLSQQPAAVNVLVVGGGPLADCIRDWDERFSLGQSGSHWLCIELLSISAKVLSNLLPEVAWIGRFDDLRAYLGRHRLPAAAHNLIFDLQPFLREVEPTIPPEPLPQDWSVTTDSIAARLAEAIDADELVLLKSVATPESADLSQLAADEFVDSYFPQVASRLKHVRFSTLNRISQD